MAVVRFDNLFSLLCSVSQGKYACSLFILLLRYFPFFSCLNVSFYGNHKWGCHRVGLCLPFTDNVKGHLWWFKREWPLLRLMYLNAWSPVGEIVWRELGSVSLLEDRCYWGWALRIEKTWPFLLFFPLLSPILCLPLPLSLSASYLWYKMWVCSCSCCHAFFLSSWTLTLWNRTPKLNTLLYVSWPWCLIAAREK